MKQRIQRFIETIPLYLSGSILGFADSKIEHPELYFPLSLIVKLIRVKQLRIIERTARELFLYL